MRWKTSISFVLFIFLLAFIRILQIVCCIYGYKLYCKFHDFHARLTFNLHFSDTICILFTYLLKLLCIDIINQINGQLLNIYTVLFDFDQFEKMNFLKNN